MRTGHRHLIFVPHPRTGTATRHAVPAKMVVVAKYPDSTKTSLTQRLTARARARWPDLASIAVRHHGTFSYVRRRPGRRHHLAPVPAALYRIRPQLALRDLPRQPPGLRRFLLSHWLAYRHLRRRPRRRLRALPGRSHSVDLTPTNLRARPLRCTRRPRQGYQPRRAAGVGSDRLAQDRCQLKVQRRRVEMINSHAVTVTDQLERV